MRDPWQFSLFRLLLMITVFAAVLGLAKLFKLDMIGGIVAASALGGIALVPKQRREKAQSPSYLGSTIATAAIVLVFYPMTIAPMGPASNGGALGLGSLVIASALAWRAVSLNRANSWLRRLVQLPLTAFVTYLVIAEVVVQYRLGRWLWF